MQIMFLFIYFLKQHKVLEFISFELTNTLSKIDNDKIGKIQNMFISLYINYDLYCFNCFNWFIQNLIQFYSICLISF
jgi:hypothetical protein